MVGYLWGLCCLKKLTPGKIDVCVVYVVYVLYVCVSSIVYVG